MGFRGLVGKHKSKGTRDIYEKKGKKIKTIPFNSPAKTGIVLALYQRD